MIKENKNHDFITVTYGSNKFKITIDECDSFNIDTCTEEELKNQCRIKGLNAYQTEQAIKHFALRLSHKEINPLSIECSKAERNRLKKKLTK